METNKSSKRGGYRPGSGRKKLEEEKLSVTLRFSPEIMEFLREKGKRKQSVYIESLILADMKKGEQE